MIKRTKSMKMCLMDWQNYNYCVCSVAKMSRKELSNLYQNLQNGTLLTLFRTLDQPSNIFTNNSDSQSSFLTRPLTLRILFYRSVVK